MDNLKSRLNKFVRSLGFDAAGVASAEPSEHRPQFLEWLQAGHHGEMHYLARNPERRADPGQVLDGAKSIVVVGKNYYTEDPPPECGPYPTYPATHAAVSRYAWGEDYHRVVEAGLKQICAFLAENGPSEAKARYYVDTGPVLEREIAARTGIGWTGKHGNIVSTEYGSWLFLGVVLTTLELEPDTPHTDRCGSCTACLDACPTDAFVAPYVLDARRCISYLTIELRDSIPEPLREKMGMHVYGCDICLQVCPWNRHEKPASPSPFEPRPEWHAPRIVELLDLNLEAFQERTRRSVIRRPKLTGMLRNACVAAGNSGNRGLLPPLRRLAKHEDPIVQEHAKWAIERLEDGEE